jgi:putative transposase
MAVRDDEMAARTERARAIGLFRYQLIREPADPGLSSKARGRLVRQIAAREHTDPAGRRVRVSRDTVDRWIRRRGGGAGSTRWSRIRASPARGCRSR